LGIVGILSGRKLCLELEMAGFKVAVVFSFNRVLTNDKETRKLTISPTATL